MHGFHHLRARMRLASELESFPSKHAGKRFLDYMMYGVGIFAPLALVPQIHQIYSTKSGAGLSSLTWTLITIVNLLWALYGAVHKDRQLFYANILMAVFNSTILIGILRY